MSSRWTWDREGTDWAIFRQDSGEILATLSDDGDAKAICDVLNEREAQNLELRSTIARTEKMIRDADLFGSVHRIEKNIAALQSELVARRAWMEHIIGHCYYESCFHGGGHVRADPTMHCCEHADLVRAYEAIERGDFGEAVDEMDGLG